MLKNCALLPKINLIDRAPRFLIPVLVEVVTEVWLDCELVVRPGLSWQYIVRVFV